MSSKRSFAASVALLACAVATIGVAADHGLASSSSTRKDMSATQDQRSALLARGTLSAAGAVQAKELVANSYRAYPASCLSYPLPTTPSGPPATKTVTLFATNSTKTASSEDVTISIWRQPCSSSGAKPSYNPDGGPVAATLMRIQRQSQFEADDTLYPVFPDIRIAQRTIAFDDPNRLDHVRVAQEPNAILSDTPIDTPIIHSTTYVLENYPGSSAGVFLFNTQFNIRFDNGYIGIDNLPTGQTTIGVLDYFPDQTTYPSAYQPLPINGYMTGSWYDPAHGGEGILTQVLEIPPLRLMSAAWYTYDQAGLPFWLNAAGTFNIGDTQVANMSTSYQTGGGFAGNFTTLAKTTWGTMTVQFIDCNTMQFSYSGTAAPVQGPVGADTRTWKRIGAINSLTCE
jgi:hypothetical protein